MAISWASRHGYYICCKALEGETNLEFPPDLRENVERISLNGLKFSLHELVEKYKEHLKRTETKAEIKDEEE